MLLGMGDILNKPELRAVCVEVHFGILEQRGKSSAPKDIVSLLNSAGFSCEWPDASHVIATK